ncbi:MAG TPA: GNAT family N-acetyltransferase, partial [Gemmatirosa sp.]
GGGTLLEIGCGIGRFEQALAPRVSLAVGVDVSPGMLAAAHRRATALPAAARDAAAFVRTGGRDLAMFRDAAFDLVLAVDAFPYVFAGGPTLANATVAEMARVVRPGGDVVIVNFSYRSDLAADRRDAAALAQRHGFELVVAGAQPFAHWDGAVFHLRRRAERRAAPRATAFAAESVTCADALARLVPEWRALHDRCPWATPFQSPEWLLAWWRHLGGGMSTAGASTAGASTAGTSDLRTIAVRDAATGVLAALLPGFTFADGPRGGARTFALLGAGVTDYGDALADPAAGQGALRSAVRHLAGEAADGAWNVAAFDELRDESPLPGALLEAEWPAGLIAARAVQSVAPARPLPGAWEGGWDAFAATLGGTFRRKLNLGANRLRRAQHVELITADARTLPAALDALFALHEARWRSRGEAGVLADDRLAEFHAEAAAGFLARGWLRLRVLRIDGSPAAVLYGLVHRGRAYCYLSGLDPAFEYYSPGVAIVRATVEAAIAEGCRTLDFLRGGERYKYLWGVEDQTTWRVTVGPTS